MSSHAGGHQEGLQGSGTSCVTRLLYFTCIVVDDVTRNSTNRVETKIFRKSPDIGQEGLGGPILVRHISTVL
jgi:hypothetical protein